MSERLETLTVRQREVLSLMIEGLRTKEVAWRMKLSEKGVKQHKFNIYKRLGCSNFTQAVVIAVREGL